MNDSKKISLTLTFGDENDLINVYYFADRPLKKLLMQAMREQTPELAEALDIKRKFLFESIAVLDNRDVQKIIRECDKQDLAKALQGVDAVKKKVFQNMSKRARLIMQEEIEYIGEIDSVDVEEAQYKIGNIIRTLEEHGEIILPENHENRQNI